MRFLIFALVIMLVPVTASAEEHTLDRTVLLDLLQERESGEWLSLFNGEDLDGWTAKITGYPSDTNYGNTFRVIDGLLTVDYSEYDKFRDRFGLLFYKKPFEHYILSLDYRFVGDQIKGGAGWAFENSGVMVHSQSPQSMGVEQDFPISIEVQFLGGTGTKSRPTANLCTPGTHVNIGGKLVKNHCIESTSETLAGEQWVHIDVLVMGNHSIEHFVNGASVMKYANPQIGGGMVSKYNKSEKIDGKALSEGYIALQSESHPLQFRNIRLLDLTDIVAASH
ncbi:MAG: hypothetical protein ACI9GW_001840 [Halieaceae bacterium]|jgi:hypothetical protein